MVADEQDTRMEQTSEPLVSVIVPCYNSRETVLETLRSLRAQTFGPWEGVIVNDASTDDSMRLAEACAEGEPRIRFVHHDRNRGLAATRNTGIREAAGRYLNFLDADDMLEPEALAVMVRTLEQRPECAGVYSGWTILHPGDDRVAVHPAPESEVTFENLCYSNKIQVPAIMVEKHAVEKAGLFDESMRRCEDWDLWIRLHRAGYRLARIGRPLAVYRDTDTGLSHAHFEQWQAACRVIDLSHSRDTRCPGCLPEHRDGPGEENRLAAYHHCNTNALRFSLARGDDAGAIRIAAELDRRKLPVPEPGWLVYALLFSLRYYPNFYDRVSVQWKGFRTTLDTVLSHLAAASGRRWYARDFLCALLFRLPDHVNRRPVLRACVRHGLLLKPVRTFRALSTAVGRRRGGRTD